MVHTRSPHLTEPCWHVFPNKEIPGEISLQTYTGCGSGVRLLSPCVGMTKGPHTSQHDSDIHVFLSNTGHLLLYCHPKPDTISKPKSSFLWLHWCPGPGYIPIPTIPAYLVFGYCSLHLPGRWGRFTGSISGAAGWPGLEQQGRVQLMLLGAAVTAVVKERCGLLWVQKDQTPVMMHDGKCALAKAELGQNTALTSSFHYIFLAIFKYNCLLPGREEVLKP